MQGGGRLSARSASSQPFTAWSSTAGLQNHIPTISCVSLLHLSSHPSHTSLFARLEASSSLFGRRQASKKKVYTPPPSRRASPQAQPSRTPPSPETPAQQPQATQAPAKSEEQATRSPEAAPTAEPLPDTHPLPPSTVPSSKRSVLIAGATVPGLTLGLLLRSSGINVDINEAEEAKVIGVTVLNVNARRILDRLGLTPALSRAGYEIFRHQEEAQQNYTVKDISYRSITSNFLGSDKKPLLPLAIQTSSLINILTNAFTKPESGVGKSILQAGSLHTLQKGANGNTMVSFSGAASSGREYSLVVGTDTPLSKNALPGFKDEVYMKKAKVIRSLYGLWSIVVERPVTDFKEFNTSVDIRAPGNRFGIIPLSKSHIYVWATASPRSGGHVLAFRAGQRDIREFPQAEIFKDFQTHSVPNILQTIQDMDGSCYVTYPRIQTLEKWYNNGPEGTSNILIGQAAYRLPPYPMHDSSMGIEDAFLLAKRLAGNDETPLESLLASFQEVRKPQVEKLQKVARALEAETQISNKLWWYAKNGVLQLTTSQLSNWNEKRLLNRVGREL